MVAWFENVRMIWTLDVNPISIKITLQIKKSKSLMEKMGPIWFGLGKSGLGILSTLTANYGVKQSQFTKPTPEPMR